MVKAILLIPTEGHPHGLLREGPCGARPPTASRPLPPPESQNREAPPIRMNRGSQARLSGAPLAA